MITSVSYLSRCNQRKKTLNNLQAALACCVSTSASNRSEFAIVNTRCGKLKGTVTKSFEDHEYCAFRGVPYAKPPVGNLRFKDPLPPEPWSGTRDATKYGNMCGQKEVVTRTIQGSDDCLYLNIFVKSINPDAKLPVMVFFHGGYYLFGSGDDMFYGPDYLNKKDVILITCNFRLGILGFLNFDDEAAPGNQSLKDQVMVLKWVQENIENFGGDPNNVTIFGPNSGGVAVHYLALSSLTKGLVHKAISQSIVPFNISSYTDGKEAAYRVCEILGNREKDPKKLVDFLQTVDVRKLIEAQERARNPQKERLQMMYSFGPGIDEKSKEPIMHIHPYDAYKTGVHIPFILGYNRYEAIFNLRGITEQDYEQLEKDFSYGLNPAIQELLKTSNLTPDELKRLYYGNEKISDDNIDKFVECYSDLNFIDGIHRTLETQVKKSSAPTYFYRFNYDRGFSFIETLFGTSTIRGASHYDDAQYLFSMGIFDVLNKKRLQPGTVAYRIMEQMTEMFANFAHHGRPTIATSDLISTYWLPVTDEKNFSALNIDEELRMENVVHLHERLFSGKYFEKKI